MNKILTKLSALFRFENAQYYFIALLTYLFVWQVTWKILHDPTLTVYLLAKLILLVIVLYLIGFHIFSKYNLHLLSFKHKIKFSTFAIATTAIYIILITYLVLTVKHVAFFAVFKGAELKDLALYREQFVRMRTGSGVILKYVYNIMIFALIPYILVQLFALKHPLRVLYLIFFLFTISLTLEKGLSENAFIPLIILALNRKQFTNATILSISLVMAISSTSFLALGGVNDFLKSPPSKSGPAQYKLANDKVDLAKKDRNFLLNHASWNPYDTAIAWLNFKHDILAGQNNYFASTHFIGPLITGKPYYPLDHEVFVYQYGNNVLATGSANVTYFIDSYIKFGLTGVIIFTLFVSFLTVFFMQYDSLALKSLFFLSLFYISQNQLPSLLFSGGIVFLMIVGLLVESPEKESVETDSFVSKIKLAHAGQL